MINEPLYARRSAAAMPSRLLWLLVPAAVLVMAIAWLVQANPLQGSITVHLPSRI